MVNSWARRTSASICEAGGSPRNSLTSRGRSMGDSVVDNLSRQAVDVKAALFEDLDPGVPSHDPAIGLHLQGFAAARGELADDGVRGLLPPIFEGELRRTGLVSRVRVDALQRWLVVAPGGMHEIFPEG